MTRRRMLGVVAGAAVTSAVAACNGQTSSEQRPPATSEPALAADTSAIATAAREPQETATATDGDGQSTTRVAAAEPTRAATVASAEPTNAQTRAAEPDPTAEPASKTAVAAEPASVKFVPLSDEEKELASRWNSAGWTTEFSKRTFDLREVKSGGPGRDGILPIRDPRFISIESGNDVFDDLEPVVVFELNGEARAYPLQILTWHEIVNDELGGEPVLVTFCPLCNTALAFSRELDGRIFTFGTSGNLRTSNLVMWDRETESWWQQVTGDAIAGEMAGSRLTFLPSAIVSWVDFKATFPTGAVLGQNTGFSRPYGRNPYSGYDSIEDTPFLFDGDVDERLKPVARVVTVSVGRGDSAYPYLELEKQNVVYDTVGGQEIVVLWAPGTVSALDGSNIADSRDVGGTGVFIPLVEGERVTLKSLEGRFFDEETGSEWNILGFAVDGPQEGKRMEPAIRGDHFWFSWAVFRPDTKIFRAA
jgi:hypothetical protein